MPKKILRDSQGNILTLPGLYIHKDKNEWVPYIVCERCENSEEIVAIHPFETEMEGRHYSLRKVVQEGGKWSKEFLPAGELIPTSVEKYEQDIQNLTIFVDKFRGLEKLSQSSSAQRPPKLTRIYVLSKGELISKEVEESEIGSRYRLIRGERDIYQESNSSPGPEIKRGPYNPDSMKKYSQNSPKSTPRKEPNLVGIVDPQDLDE